jgi:hypothetical protein
MFGSSEPPVNAGRTLQRFWDQGYSALFRLDPKSVTPRVSEIRFYARAVVQSGSALVYDPPTRMDQSEPNLKVIDRRHFTAEGELKAEESSPSQEAVAAAAPDVPATPMGTDTGDAHPVSFSSFIVSLATQAADYIGGEQRDLGAARQMISALEMLKDKSEGRRTDEESRIIEAVLFDLRLAFVGATKGARV